MLTEAFARSARTARAAALIACVVQVQPAHAAPDGIYGFTAEDGSVYLSDVPENKRYKLMLRNPEDYKVKPSGQYRLASPDAPQPSQAPFDLQAETTTHPALEARPYHAEIAAAAKAHGVDAALIHSVIRAESAYNPAALSSKGAVGLMQLMPDTARRYGVRDSKDPRQNIDGGTRYLRDLIQLFVGDLKLVVAAYNAGENAVLRYGSRIPPYAETLQYVPRVLNHYKRFVLGGESMPHTLRERPKSL